MSAGALLGVNAGVVLVYMFVLWLVSVRVGDVSFIDAAWGIGFVLVAAVSFARTDGGDGRRGLILGITSVWGLRLGGYLFSRWRRQGPDPRYLTLLRNVKGNKHAFTLTRIFLTQGVLMWIVSLPLQMGQFYAQAAGLAPQAIVGVALAVFGIAFESVADAQLVRFKADPSGAGTVMDRGLWRFSRHPNYFGETCVWWGLYLLALANFATFLTVVGPITITTLLLKWSGIGPLERRLRRHRPGYEEYARRTSAFVPMPPKPAA